MWNLLFKWNSAYKLYLFFSPYNSTILILDIGESEYIYQIVNN